MRDLKDSLDSLHQRMDRFYAWASQLQVEMRNVQQRVKFLENTLENNASFNNMNSKSPSWAISQRLMKRKRIL